MRVPTAAVTAGSLIGGWQVARRTGALVATYLGAFGLSHPLAKRIGAWPSVLLVSAVTSAASYAAADRRLP